MKKNWWLRKCNADNDFIKQFSREIGVTSAFARLLVMRGIDSIEKYDSFISKTATLSDPFLLPDMKKAVDRIVKALENKEKILIYGDYDADGVSSVSLMLLYLRSKGADVSYYIPSRFTDGYGLSNTAVNELSQRGISLIITVDTGITAIDEIANAVSMGIDFVVTDHHECKSVLPDSVANVDPKRSDTPAGVCEYAGVGVAMKLVQALESVSGNSSAEIDILEKYADIVTLGTIADIMSLTGENRVIVKKGLEKINSGNCREGIRALIEKSGKVKDYVTARTVGFVIAPRINAAGRMDSAEAALSLITCDNRDECADIAQHLCDLNSQRQSEENRIAQEAMEILSRGEYDYDDILVLANDNWHHGVIGIVCSRISEKYKKPVILLSVDGEGIARGSCRSIRGLNIYKAIESASEYVIKFGGHDMAAGVTLHKEMIDSFRKAVNAYARSHPEDFSTDGIQIDIELSLRELTLPFAKQLRQLEPCGKGNSEPLFLTRGVRIANALALSEGKHTKLILKRDGICFECIAFNFDMNAKGICPGDEISVVFTLETKEYMGRESVQANLKDFCFEGVWGRWFEAGAEASESFFQSADQSESLFLSIPTREDFARVYQALKTLCGFNGRTIGYKPLSEITGISSYTHLRVICRIFNECGLLKLEKDDEYGAYIKLVKLSHGKKADIEAAKTYIKLKSQLNK